MLEVRLIGTFEVKWDNKPVTISSRTAQSLLAYLLLNAGKSYRREKLAGMFWPEATEKKARAYLRNELWHLRKAIPSNDFLISDDIGIGFNLDTDYWLDSESLLKLNDTSSADELIVALTNYTGELLPSFYDEWILHEREHLQAVYEQKMGRLLELLESDKRWNEILEWAEHWISFGQGPEAAYQYLMIAYNALGDHVRVTSTFERCRKALRTLDLDPSEQTRALAFKRNSKLNVPIPLTSFVGREKELEEVAGLLSKSRLVTLTGSGGVGKTRLAVQIVAEVFDRFPDGVWFLDLAPLSDSTLVPNTLASLLGFREAGGSNIPIITMLINYFHSRTALVIFDNCEHLIDSCAILIYSLLTSCEKLSVLATSREILRVSGEISYRVPSLEIPKLSSKYTIENMMGIESVKLFTERASAATSGFAIDRANLLVIAQICQRLDGIPLAIELAATRVDVLTVKQIYKRLDNRFTFLAGGPRTATSRHQTIRATIEWSYNLLSVPEQVLFRRLAVFVGGWTLDAAERVCTEDGIEYSEILNLLSKLVNKSLIIAQSGESETRYRRLETIRQFAGEKLAESGEVEHFRWRHMKYFLELTSMADSELYGREQFTWLQRLEAEQENLRAALEWADKTDIEAGLCLSSSLLRFWENMDFREGKYWLVKSLQKPESHNYKRARARALCAYGWISVGLQELDAARSSATECLLLNREIGDQLGELDGLLLLAWISPEWKQNWHLNHQALELAQRLGDIRREATASWQLGWLYQRLDWSDEEGRDFVYWWERSASLSRGLGDWRLLSWTLSTLGFFLVLNGENDSAKKYLDESNIWYRKFHMSRPPSHLLSAYGQIALIRGDFKEARTYFLKLISIHELAGSREGLLWTRARLGYVALQEANFVEAHQIFEDTVRDFQNDGRVIGVVYVLEGIARLFMSTNKNESAARLIGWANAMREEINDARPLLEEAEIDKTITKCIAKMGKAKFSRAYNTGKEMTLEEAVVYAFGST